MIRENSNSVILSSLGQICHKQPLTNRMRQINKLFEQSQRQIFELTYLYTSPHINSDPSFREIVKVLQNFNQETQSLQLSKIKPKYIKRISTIQVSCMHLLYQQMLNIAVMGEKQLKINNFAAKLKQWYLSLHDNHNFMEGKGHTWKKVRLNKENNMEEKIRQTFKSNVCDQIDGYLRKKVNYSYPSDQDLQKENSQNNQIKNIPYDADKDYFPNIDTIMYRREQNLLSDIRQKKMEKDYLNSFISNKISNRQNSLKKLHHEFLYRNKPAVTEHRKDVSSIYNSFKYQNDLQINNSNHNNSSSNADRTQRQNVSFNLRSNSKIINRSSQKKNSSTVMNVNGINIINQTYQ